MAVTLICEYYLKFWMKYYIIFKSNYDRESNGHLFVLWYKKKILLVDGSEDQEMLTHS